MRTIDVTLNYSAGKTRKDGEETFFVTIRAETSEKDYWEKNLQQRIHAVFEKL